MVFHSKVYQLWLRIFLLFLTPTSFLLIPAIQGTTVANLALITLLFPISGLLILSIKDYEQLWVSLLPYIFFFILLFLLSRLPYLFQQLGTLGLLRLVNPRPGFLPLTMVAHITQSLYLLMGLTTYLVTKRFYDNSWDKWLFIGVWILIVYGLVEWAGFLFFNQNWDFASNRVFGELQDSNVGNGSLRQVMSVLGLNLLRFKSLTGEPSMFAITALSMLTFALVKNRWFTSLGLTITLLLSFSATAYAGLLLIFVLYFNFIKFENRMIVLWLVSLAIVVLCWSLFDVLYDQLDAIFFSKASSYSGMERNYYFWLNFNYWYEAKPLVWLFGVGFGTIRSTDLFSTLLVNCGAIGTGVILIAVFAFVIKHIIQTNFFIGLSLLVVFLLMLISVPEFAYLPPWFLAGYLANQSLRKNRDLSHANKESF